MKDIEQFIDSGTHLVLPSGGGRRVPIRAWVKGGVSVEDGAIGQLKNVASMPYVKHHVAAMPDVHFGKGATVGTVIACAGAIPPAAVGVDIGCGMIALRTTFKKINDAQAQDIYERIRSRIPTGRTDNGGENDRGAWHDVPEDVRLSWAGQRLDGYDKLLADVPTIGMRNQRAPESQLGTLGGGNHFIEISSGDDGAIWIVVHTGSRGIGNKIAQIFVDRAKDAMRKYMIDLPDAELAYLPEGTDDFKLYMRAVSWAQDYAKESRRLIANRAFDIVARICGEGEIVQNIDCHHNYVTIERHFHDDLYVVRKGAIRARKSDLGIIPGSMGTASYIVRGKGEPLSFTSSSHGSGRTMSRTEAKNTFNIEMHRRATEGIVCDKGSDVIDETPGAYKDIETTMAAQADLVEKVVKLTQIVNVKGIEDSKNGRKR